MRRSTFGILLATFVVFGVAPVPAAAAATGRPPPQASTPTVEGPVTGGKGEISLVTSSYELLAPNGYVAEEYFLGGTATGYEPARPLRENGRWALRGTSHEPYKTRMVVFRPEDPSDFNGTVYVEWLNVTAGFDTSAVWSLVHNEIMRSGAAWIGVSAQAGGVQGSDTVLPGATPGGVRGGDPERYGSLHHPGDLYSFDIFSQSGVAAAGKANGSTPLDRLTPKRVVAIGKSQAAFRLVSYVDGVHPLARVYDGFLIASRHASGSPLGESNFGLANDTVPDRVIIRTDTDVPVFVVQTESDLEISYFGSATARQPDTKRFRLWEIAGAAHADAYSGVTGLTDGGDGAAELALLDPARLTGGPLNCRQLVNSGPAFAVLSASVSQLDRWVRDGTPPPKAARFVNEGNELVRDEHGIARGGIRSPIVDVPIATNTGLPNEGGSFCDLFGTAAPFDAATIASLYPSQQDYVREFERSADATVKAGFWPKPNAENFKKAAAQINVG